MTSLKQPIIILEYSCTRDQESNDVAEGGRNNDLQRCTIAMKL
jgi:hypothetical protein